MKDQFADNIKILRLGSGMTQQELADIIEVNVNTIRAWEQELKSPSLNNLMRLSEFFHISIDDLIGIDNEYQISEANVIYLSRFVDIYRKADDKELHILEVICDFVEERQRNREIVF